MSADYSLTQVQEDARLMVEAALEIQRKQKASAVFLPVIDEFVPRFSGVKVVNSFEAGTVFPETAGQSLKHLEAFSFKVSRKCISPLKEAIYLLKAESKIVIIKLPDLPLVLSTMISLEEMIRAPRQQPSEFHQGAQKINDLILLYAQVLEQAGADYLSLPLTHLAFFGGKYYRQYYLEYYQQLLDQLKALEKVKIIVNADAVNLLNLQTKMQKGNLTAIVDDVKLDGVFEVLDEDHLP